MTTFAGRLMPVLRVEVATRTTRKPLRKPLSMICFSSLVKPEWWYAMPCLTTCFRIVHRPAGHACSSCISLSLPSYSFLS